MFVADNDDGLKWGKYRPDTTVDIFHRLILGSSDADFADQRLAGKLSQRQRVFKMPNIQHLCRVS